MGAMTTTSPRPPAAEPTGRRAELLVAAVEVLAESGLRGLTHRAVDARAGLPQGTCSAYLRTRLALLEALAAYVGTRLEADVEAFAHELRTAAATGGAGADADGGALLRERLTTLLLCWLEHPTVVRAQAELSLEAARQPSLLTVFDRWRRSLVDTVEHLGEVLGREVRPHRARVVVVAIEGILVGAVQVEADVREAFVREAVLVLVEGLREDD